MKHFSPFSLSPPPLKNCLIFSTTAINTEIYTRTLLVTLSLACLKIRFAVKGAGAVMIFFRLEYETSVIICLARSKRSDSGERCEVKKAMKSRGGLGREVRKPLRLPRFYFFALLFTSHRSPLSEIFQGFYTQKIKR